MDMHVCLSHVILFSRETVINMRHNRALSVSDFNMG